MGSHLRRERAEFFLQIRKLKYCPKAKHSNKKLNDFFSISIRNRGRKNSLKLSNFCQIFQSKNTNNNTYDLIGTNRLREYSQPFFAGE